MTNGTLTLRKATVNDAAELLIIDNMSSHGMSLTFWMHATGQGLTDDPLIFARERFSDPASVFGWSNAIVAEMDGRIAGAVTGYEMPAPDEETEMIKKDFPGFAPVFELFGKVVGDWFVDSLGVYPEHRGKSIAARLLDQCLEAGRLLGKKQVSLVVEDGNGSALRVYKKRGFTVRDSLPYVQGNQNSQSQNWLLLTRSL